MAKYILQQLWISKVDWDDTPPQAIIDTWDRFKTELPKISNISLPRLFTSNPISQLEVHGFCDASSIGYGCAIYFRFLHTTGVTSKSRVAPLQVLSLPRLELCSAHLLAKFNLLKSVLTSYSDLLTFNSIYAWSDSQVALAWISASPHKWKTFVGNRVAQIQDIVPVSSWRYVPTQSNPADCVSRGLTPQQLLDHELWWQGPTFLSKDYEAWPEQPQLILDNLPEINREEKYINLHLTVKSPTIVGLLFEKFSSLRKIQRVLVYVLRFIAGIKRLFHALPVLMNYKIHCVFWYEMYKKNVFRTLSYHVEITVGYQNLPEGFLLFLMKRIFLGWAVG